MGSYIAILGDRYVMCLIICDGRMFMFIVIFAADIVECSCIVVIAGQYHDILYHDICC